MKILYVDIISVTNSVVTFIKCVTMLIINPLNVIVIPFLEFALRINITITLPVTMGEWERRHHDAVYCWNFKYYW